jgi:hypothetical protein
MNAHEQDRLLRALERRFADHRHRHAQVSWPAVLGRLQGQRAALQALAAMEATGGEPDVVAHEGNTGQLVFCDCSPESPAGRRSLCFDGAARRSRKENAPAGSALEMAASMGVHVLTEAEYRALQQLGEFDTKTSSWIATPPDVRALGGALFCDRRYGQVFTYHNGAPSYYAVRGFRARLVV